MKTNKILFHYSVHNTWLINLQLKFVRTRRRRREFVHQYVLFVQDWCGPPRASTICCAASACTCRWQCPRRACVRWPPRAWASAIRPCTWDFCPYSLGYWSSRWCHSSCWSSNATCGRKANAAPRVYRKRIAAAARVHTIIITLSTSRYKTTVVFVRRKTGRTSEYATMLFYVSHFPPPPLARVYDFRRRSRVVTTKNQ